MLFALYVAIPGIFGIFLITPIPLKVITYKNNFFSFKK